MTTQTLNGHDRAKQMLTMFGLAVGVAYALHCGSVWGACVGFVDEFLMIGFVIVKKFVL